MRISYWSSDVCSSSLTAWAWHANRGASFGLRQLQRRLQQREQALELAGHQREAGIELGTDVLGLRAFELVDHAVEELQLADDQVLAEPERDEVVDHPRALSTEGRRGGKEGVRT